MSSLQAFKSTFRGDIVTSSDPSYMYAISRWASNSERQAKYVLFPRNAEAVALAILFATKNKLSIAIRGGGHSVSGSSSVQDGVVIDLSRFLNGVKIDPLQRLAFVGGGAIWETVETAAIKHGLATVAGTVNETGVGGLTLGGGWGFLTGEHGLSLDNVKEVTVVTASGSILPASPNYNPDLFWGIRGGGCNFGVVTEFVFTLHPQRNTVFGGALVFQPLKLEKLVNTAVQWWRNAGPKEAGSFIIARFPYTPTVCPISTQVLE
jgi:FAD/FMN-containing dehydrogenase